MSAQKNPRGERKERTVSRPLRQSWRLSGTGWETEIHPARSTLKRHTASPLPNRSYTGQNWGEGKILRVLPEGTGKTGQGEGKFVLDQADFTWVRERVKPINFPVSTVQIKKQKVPPLLQSPVAGERPAIAEKGRKKNTSYWVREDGSREDRGVNRS